MDIKDKNNNNIDGIFFVKSIDFKDNFNNYKFKNKKPVPLLTPIFTLGFGSKIEIRMTKQNLLKLKKEIINHFEKLDALKQSKKIIKEKQVSLK